MNSDIEAAVRAAISEVAPEADFSTLDHDEDLQQALDLDSMDFLNVLIALGRTTGVEIPESDYGRVRTFTACVNYLSGRVR